MIKLEDHMFEQKPQSTQMIYRGSVKNVLQSPQDDNSLYFNYSDRYSIFDWGEMPDHITSKGVALNLMGFAFFQLVQNTTKWKSLKNHASLQKFNSEFLDLVFSSSEYLEFCTSGVLNHFKALVVDHEAGELKEKYSSLALPMTSLSRVEKIHVERPKALPEGKYDYSAYENKLTQSLIPLEVMFRIGLAPDNSLSKRLKKNKDLNQQFVCNYRASNAKTNEIDLLQYDQSFLPFVAIDFSTKLEHTDRYVNYQEAQNLAGLSEAEFLSLIRRTQLIALILMTEHEELHLELWDGKIEWAFNSQREFMLVDSIGIDELRLVYNKQKISKEFLREYYRKTPWYHHLNEAKEKSVDFKSYCLFDLESYPEVLPVKLKKQVVDLYLSYAVTMIRKFGFEISKEFKNHIGLGHHLDNLKDYISEYTQTTDKLNQRYFNSYRVLVVGSGGREQALCQKIIESDSFKNDQDQIWITPSHAGVGLFYPFVQNLNFKAHEAHKISEWCVENKINLVVIGPEVALAEGLTDLLTKNNIAVFGPNQFLAQLETSKKFAKIIMQKANIATAEYFSFQDYQKAKEFVQASAWQKMVIKCDGLAAGKGVVVCESKDQAQQALNDFFNLNILGFKVDKIIIEEFLEGPEVSAFAIYSGYQSQNNYCVLTTACDHKRLLDFDQGPNTGGMGVLAPAPFVSEADLQSIENSVFKPLSQYFKSQKLDYRGVIFAGLMKTKSGYKVLEFNARFGDPETQAILNLLDLDFLHLVITAALGKDLSVFNGQTSSTKKAVHVVLAAKGYPGLGTTIEANQVIKFDEKKLKHKNSQKIKTYFAGVKQNSEHEYVTSGGRVLGLTAISDSYNEAFAQVYHEIERNKLVEFNNEQFRKDIGVSSLKLNPPRKRIVILASGTGTNAISIIKKQKQIENMNYEVVAVISDRSQAQVLKSAPMYGVPCFLLSKKSNESEAFYQQKLALFIKNLSADYIVLAGFMKLLNKDFLKQFQFFSPLQFKSSQIRKSHEELIKPRYRVINIHPTVLPEYPGVNGYENTYADAQANSGCTIHFVDEGMDTGEIVMQKTFERTHSESLQDYKKKGLELENNLYPQVLNQICEMNMIQNDLEVKI